METKGFYTFETNVLPYYMHGRSQNIFFLINENNNKSFITKYSSLLICRPVCIERKENRTNYLIIGLQNNTN